MLYDAVDAGLSYRRSEEVYVAPRQAFPWYLRRLPLSVICRRYWKGKDSRVLNLHDTQLNILTSCMYPAPQFDDGQYVWSRVWVELRPCDSALGKKLDMIIWKYLIETKKLSVMIDKLDASGERTWSDTLQSDIRGFACACVQKLIDEIDAWDRDTIPKREQQKTITEELRQGENRILVTNAQMLHDDLTVCQPAKLVATQN
jgi:hypothetical protein